MGRIARVKYSRRFLKALSRLPQEMVRRAQEKENIFKENPFGPRLDTHKLHGKEKDVWAFAVTRTYRIKFFFVADTEVLFLNIGTHDIYQ